MRTGNSSSVFLQIIAIWCCCRSRSKAARPQSAPAICGCGWRLNGCGCGCGSEPEPYPGDQADRIRVFACNSRKARRFASLFAPFNADVRRNFLFYFIAEAQACFKVGQARADANGRYIAFHIRGQMDVDLARWLSRIEFGSSARSWLSVSTRCGTFSRPGGPLSIAIHWHWRKAGNAPPHFDLRRN